MRFTIRRQSARDASHQEFDLMTKSLLTAIFVAASLSLSNAVCGSDLSGKWTLSVENPEHLVMSTLKVEFTDKEAVSCMGGEWKVLKGVSLTTRDKNFFAASDP